MEPSEWPLRCRCGMTYKTPQHAGVYTGASRGLGDTIAKFTSALGIKPCGGCTDRQETLNRLVPYKILRT